MQPPTNRTAREMTVLSETCGNCQFFKGTVNSANMGRCFRYPPSWTGTQGPVTADWPDVRRRDWCGEYQAAPPSEDK